MAETGFCHEKPVFAMVPTSLNPLPLLTPSNPFHISVGYDRLYHPEWSYSIFGSNIDSAFVLL